MGLGASQARFLNLTHQLTSVQRRAQSVNQERSALASQMNQMTNNNRSVNPFVSGGGQSPEFLNSKNSNNKSNNKNNNNNNSSTNQSTNVFDTLMSTLETSLSQFPGANRASGQVDQSKLASIQAQDKRLEMLLKTLDTQEQAVKTEIGAVQKVIDKNVEQSFKLLA